MSEILSSDRTFAREKARVNREELLYYILSVFFFLVALLIYTYPSVQMVQTVYREQQVKAKGKQLMAEQNRLRLKYEMMMSPDEMETRAVNSGFSAPQQEQVVYVRKL